ncbi:response regulator [Paenibacillus cellulositrophicus]|uniref:response regulator n=1 Tax=Paenibacillus cellulositrophicus TaxID=562959 RepID=UPI00203AB0A0|nr:response regulator [Paenibacillus cellulositrophicus]MCM2996468.1 response regulator [Paenibacillus cellulositrophicus]
MKSNYDILCVEDDGINMSLMRHIFKKIPNATMWEACTGEEAVEIATARCPDLIIMDIQLPGMSGYDALARLQANEKTKAIPVVAVSSYAMASDIAKGRQAGFIEYVTKPFYIKHFIQVIDSILRRLPF